MTLIHLVVTVFSIRGPKWYDKFDPLKSEDLDFRFKLFEVTCLPSVLEQTCQDFIWVIIVDQALGSIYRDRLHRLIKARKHTYVLDFPSGHNVAEYQWVERYWDKGFNHVLTTNIDDDDVMPKNYIRSLQKKAIDSIVADVSVISMIMGCKQILQWDLLSSTDAPLGWKCPWHKSPRASSCGFSLLCDYENFPVNILQIGHSKGENYLDFTQPPINENVAVFRRMFQDAWSRKSIIEQPSKIPFIDMHPSVGYVIMTNHFRNNQTNRLFEKKVSYQPVVGPASFPGMPINWSMAREYSGEFRLENRYKFAPKKRISVSRSNQNVP